MIQVSIVEDNDVVRNNLKKFIDSQVDMECKETYSNGEDAIKGFLLNKPDVIIMDIELSKNPKKLTGLECMMHVKRRSPNVLVLMYTIFDTDETLFQALKIGANGYILKSTKVSKIVNAIREVVDGGAPMSKSIAKKIINSFHKPIKKKDKTPMDNLTDRQFEILELVAKGLPNKLIAEKLGISSGTIRIHLYKIYSKLHVKSRTEAAALYHESLKKL
ncbi:MAG: response regulator transcription factor [Bacteroidota bacterium]